MSVLNNYLILKHMCDNYNNIVLANFFFVIIENSIPPHE